MPIMVHPYVDNIKFHAVGSFVLNSITGSVEFTVNMVYGKTEKATNPTADAEKIQIILKRNKYGSIELDEQVSSLKNKLPRSIKNTLISFYNEVEEYIRSEFATRALIPENINIEFVVLNSFLNLSPSVVVLQYEANLNKEVLISILNGEINRKLVDKKIDPKKIFELGIFSNTDKKTIEYNKAYRIDELSIEQTELLMKRLTGNFGSYDIRYALMKDNVNQQPFLVIWQGAFHRAIKSNIQSNQYEWILSGYLSMKKQLRKHSQIYFSFKEIIGETNFENTPNEIESGPMVDINLSENLFRNAWNFTIENNKPFKYFLNQNNINQVMFFIEEGEYRIDLKP
jgi:hypothetical protein